MYSFRHSKPKLCGYIYRRKVKCGKPTCHCAKDDKHRHSAYYLQYRERINGKWFRRSEYVPRSQVRALRARIKRAKQQDLKMQAQTRKFLSQMPGLIKRIEHNPFDITAIDNAKKLIETLNPKPITRLQGWKRFSILVDVLAAVLDALDNKIA